MSLLYLIIGRFEMVRKLAEILQSNRYKLLYFFYKRKKVHIHLGLKSELYRSIGYKSDGHHDYDWKILLENKLIEEKNDHVIITDEGKKEFNPEDSLIEKLRETK